MTKNFIISINALIDTFSRIESGKKFDFSVRASGKYQGLDKISIGDHVIASLENKIYYHFNVVSLSNDRIKLKKTFEIEKSIDYELSEDGLFKEISDYDYNSICSQLFKTYQNCPQENSEERIDLPIKEKNIGYFVFQVLSYLYEIDELNSIRSHLKRNDDRRYVSIYDGDIYLTSIFRVSNKALTEEDVTSGGKPRNFTERKLFKKDDENYYLSTEWTSGTGSRLDLDSFEKLINTYYSDYSIRREGGYYLFLLKESQIFSVPQVYFDFMLFENAAKDSGLKFSEGLIQRFVASLQTKQFVILTGLAGSGKTKLVEAFSSWVCENKDQICMIAVGADWTSREPLLGFPNALESDDYVKPESGVIDLIISAQRNPKYPYFLILDEMNMSHVERYFSDFLSAMESVNSTILLHSGCEAWSGVPSQIILPKNLFIIGTVNVDETTYMFSPKVLDRANVIEFRVSKHEMDAYLKSPIKLDMKKLNGKGVHMAQDFVSIALSDAEKSDALSLGDKLMPFFNDLQNVGAEFGYRTVYEINRFIDMYNKMLEDPDYDSAIDAAIAQKLLPKLHGSRNKLEKTLVILAKQCLHDTTIEDAFKGVSEDDIKYPISYEKLQRMHERIMADGFTSFAEA